MKSNIPLISVVLPVYNVESYIREAINSILNQSYTNIEIIIYKTSNPNLPQQIVDGKDWDHPIHQ